MEQRDTRNLILAMTLSLLLLYIWNFFFGPDPKELPEQNPPAEAIVEEEQAPISREEALAQNARVVIETPKLGGSINLTGGYVDDLTLHDYKETLSADSPDVKLLEPKGVENAYYFQTGFNATEGTDSALAPSFGDNWSVKSGNKLTPESPIVLTWTSPAGVIYEREFAIDANYMFTITETVTNNSNAAIKLQPLSVVTFKGTPQNRGTYVLHEGAIANIDGVISETSYKDMRKATVSSSNPAIHFVQQPVESDGWIGMTSKYWLTALIPQSGSLAEQATLYNEKTDTYNVSAYQKPLSIEPGAKASLSNRIYSGAKEVRLIRDYQNSVGINRFDDTVDWGWFYFLTKPFFSLLHWLYTVFGNMGLAIIALTFVIKAVLFPLAYRSSVSMSKMKKLQPQIEQMKQAIGDDRMKLQQGMMELYKREKVNPVSGCLPIFLQIPIFFSLYKVLYVTTELRHASFFGPWQDLSAPDPTSIFNLFGLLPWAAPETGSMLATIALGILPILLGISMWLTQKLNPTPADETQKMIFTYMPWIFMFMMGGFATGLILYWITNNILTFIQQYSIMRTQGVEVDLFGNIFGRKKKV